MQNRLNFDILEDLTKLSLVSQAILTTATEYASFNMISLIDNSENPHTITNILKQIEVSLSGSFTIQSALNGKENFKS